MNGQPLQTPREHLVDASDLSLNTSFSPSSTTPSSSSLSSVYKVWCSLPLEDSILSKSLCKCYLGQGGLFSIPPTFRDSRKLTPLQTALVESAPMARQDENRQMTVSLSALGANMQHRRGPHCLVTKDIGSRLAEFLRLTDLDRALLEAGALLHDVGHTPFGHTGERIMQRLACWYKFDHDQEGCKLIEHSPIRDILRRHGLSWEQVVNVLRDDPHSKRRDDLHFLVKEIADPMAYLEMDYQGTNFPELKKLMVYKLTEMLADKMERVRLNGKDFVAFTEEAIHLRGAPGPLLAKILFRDQLFQEYSNHPVSELANAILLQAITGLVEDKRLSLNRFPKMTDKEVMDLFSERQQFWLLGNVDRTFEPVAAFRFSDFTHSGQQALNSLVTRQVKESLKGVIPADEVFVCTTPDYSKTCEFLLKHDNGNYTRESIKTHVGDERRFFFVALPKDTAGDIDRATTMVEETLLNCRDVEGKRVLKPEAISMAYKVFQHIDPGLFNY